jgi:hypothetical protein
VRTVTVKKLNGHKQIAALSVFVSLDLYGQMLDKTEQQQELLYSRADVTRRRPCLCVSFNRFRNEFVDDVIIIASHSDRRKHATVTSYQYVEFVS